MPSTITNYFVFSAGTPARATQVNSNFSNYRGDIIPINESTATASDNEHNLGALDHRWRSLYVNGLIFQANANTKLSYLEVNDSAASANLSIRVESDTLCSFATSSVSFHSDSFNVSATSFQVDIATTGTFEILVDGATAASLDGSNGFKRRSLAPAEWTNGSLDVNPGYFVLLDSTTLSFNANGVGSYQTIFDLPFNAKGGGLVEVSLVNGYRGPNIAGANFALSSYWRLRRGLTTTALTTVVSYLFEEVNPSRVNCSIRFIDASCPSGPVVYQMQMYASSNTNSTYHVSGQWLVREL